MIKRILRDESTPDRREIWAFVERAAARAEVDRTAGVLQTTPATHQPRGTRAAAQTTRTTMQARMGYQPKADQTDGERIASIETLVGDMHTRLFGNGQPGELETIKKRIGTLESWFWRAIGGGAVVVFIIERFK